MRHDIQRFTEEGKPHRHGKLVLWSEVKEVVIPAEREDAKIEALAGPELVYRHRHKIGTWVQPADGSGPAGEVIRYWGRGCTYRTPEGEVWEGADSELMPAAEVPM